MTAEQTEASFEDILALAKPEQQPLCQALRDRIASLHSGYVELAWPRQKIASFGVGPKEMSQHYAYIAVQGAHVNLGFYQGAWLTDPDGLLEGTGKNLRHVKLRDVPSCKSKAVTALLKQAIIERKPFA